MPIDTRVPAWLERNWAPREAFDPTPWLQERYRRQERQQEISLRVQEFGVRKQELELAIQQKAMANEQASIEMSNYREELPLFSDWLKSTGGDPLKITSGPLPTLTNPKLMERAIAIRKQAADSRFVQARTKFATAQAEAAARFLEKGILVEPNEDGTFDPEKLAAAGAELDRREQAQSIDLRKATLRDDITPEVRVIEGKKFLVNPRTGAVHAIDKTITKQAFIAQHITQWLDQPGVMNEQDAAARLSQFYDTHIGPASSGASTGTNSVQQIGRFKVNVR